MTNTNLRVYPINGHGSAARRLWGASFLIILLTLLGACLNPFADDKNGDNALVNTPEYRENTGGVRISIGDDGLSTATILPESTLTNVIVTYDVLLTGHSGGADNVSELGVSPEDFPFSLGSIETGDWVLTVDARDGDGGIVGTFTEQITISDGVTTSVPVVIRGTQSGTGRLEYTLSWPAADANGWDVEIIAGSYSIDPNDRTYLVFEDILQTGIVYPPYEVDSFTVTEAEGRYTLSLDVGPIASGTYFLVVTLWQDDGKNAPIIEAAQVYDNRTSRKTVDLPEGALSQPPPPPEDFTLNYTAGQVHLSWVSGEPNTALEFEIMRGNTFIGMPLGSVTSWIDEALNPVPEETYTYTITAYNNYGISPSVSQAITIPTPELVGQWRFDEGAELDDTSGNGNTLIQTDMQIQPAYSEEPAGTGNFYPVLTQDDHGYTVEASNNLATGIGGHTYSFWFRNTSVDANFGTFGQQGTLIRRDRLEGELSTDRMIFWLGAPFAANRLEMAINNFAVSIPDVEYGAEGHLITGAWNMITVALNYDEERIDVYVNGDHVWGNTTFLYQVGNMQDEGPFYVGRYPNADGGNVVPADRSVFGHIDDVRIYNYPLEAAAIEALHAEGRQ